MLYIIHTSQGSLPCSSELVRVFSITHFLGRISAGYWQSKRSKKTNHMLVSPGSMIGTKPVPSVITHLIDRQKHEYICDVAAQQTEYKSVHNEALTSKTDTNQ